MSTTAPAIRLLLIEDQLADAELISRLLLRAGLRATFERVDSEVGLRRQLEQFDPDIVLSDFSLPGFDGMYALQMVRAARPLLPFVFVSGTLGEDRAIEALRCGATDYVLKTNLSRLAPAVTRALADAANAAARRDAEIRLRDNERRLRDIIDTSQDWIWELDSAGRFTFASDAVRKILGTPSEEILGTGYADLLHPDDRWRAQQMLPASPGHDHRDTINNVTARWRHKDGSYRWLERSAIALHVNGRLVGYRGTERDVTERLQHETRIDRLHRIHTLLSSVNSVVAHATDRARMLQEICRLGVERGGYARVVVGLVNTPGAVAVRPVAWDSSLSNSLSTLAYPIAATTGGNAASLVATALGTLRAAVCNDLASATAAPIRYQAELNALGIRAVAILPMIVDGKAVGVVSFESKEPQVFDSEELALLTEVATDIGFSLQYFDKDEAVRFLSWFDPLTQLARRDLFCERFARVLATTPDVPAAVLVVDVERMGFINDSLGRDIGDQLLRAAAERLKTRLGNPDRLAHFGAGTFAIALGGEDSEGPGLEQTRQRVRELFAETFRLVDREIDVSIRTGLARFPQDASDPTALVQNAEAALRRARETNVDDFDYTITINSQLAERMLVGQKLNRALEQNQYVLHYQPLVDIDRGRIIGAEALLRWQDPDRGLVPPNSFIPLLEQSGQIVEVGQWVFEQVARDATTLRQAGIEQLRLGVNISPLQLRRADFVDRIADVAFHHPGVDPLLEVEITESMLMQDLEGSIQKLAQLRELGIRVSIDDFGTGYSSLALLARLPIDTLKIDRSFISTLAEDPAAMTVVSTIIGLARSFRLTAVAEGVETEEQLKLLRLMKCDIAQGFHFGPPMPLAQLIAQIKVAPAPEQRTLQYRS